MIIIGITGSIAMGKSTVASLLRRLGCPTHDSDASVHRLFSKGGAGVAPVAARFPDALKDGAIDRPSLSKFVLNNKPALDDLEAIVHPLVHKETKRFLLNHYRRQTAVVALDIPLLFEVGADKRVDAVWVVNCPPALQEQRYMQRPGASLEVLSRIRTLQMPHWQKLKRASCIVQTGGTKQRVFDTLRAELASLKLAMRDKPSLWPLSTYRNPAMAGRLHL